MNKIYRLLEKRISQALASFPVIYIAGPRQAGKTTLVQAIAKQHPHTRYITFDDLQIRSAAQYDPDTFLRRITGPCVLDEIQLVPELFRPLKIIVDENRNYKDGGRGKFILTGSASVMALPKLSDALVGRMTLHTLLPLSAREIYDPNPLSFIDTIFLKDWQFAQLPKENIVNMMLKSSFPELLTLANNSLRYEWCNGYINTILQRDIRVLMEIEKIAVLPNLLRLLAAKTGGILNAASLSREANLNHLTIKKYRALLENLFLTQSVPAWSSNLGKKLIKAPKIYINDLNLLAYLLNIDLHDLPQHNPHLFGHVLENFVVIELSKQITFSTIRAALYHYRSASGQEVDLLLEGPQNQIIGIEIKARSKVIAKDFLQLETLKKDLGKKFLRGVVLYNGTDIVPFGIDMWAIPLTSLWT